MMKRFIILFFSLLCQLFAAEQSPLVMLDIGHSTKDRGASSPDRRLTETAFWYKNAGEVKRLIEEAGYLQPW